MEQYGDQDYLESGGFTKLCHENMNHHFGHKYFKFITSTVVKKKN